MFFSPLAQFDIVQYIPLRFLNLIDLSINNAIMTVFCVILFLFFILKSIEIEGFFIIPTRYQIIMEQLYLFIYKIVIEQSGKDGLKFFTWIFTMFLFILSLNLISMLPFGFAVTTHIVWTLVFTFSLIVGLLFLGFYRHQVSFIKMFVPDVPVALYVLMIPLEIVSYFIRAFSLGIRLSANILAGHTLVHIIADMSQGISVINLDLTLLCLILLCGIMVMELGVACLQAYIFTLLMTIYINDIYNLAGH